MPDAPTNLIGTPTETTIEWSWTAPDPEPDYYELAMVEGTELTTGDADSNVIVTEHTSLSYTATELTPTTSYTARVRAVNDSTFSG